MVHVRRRTAKVFVVAAHWRKITAVMLVISLLAGCTTALCGAAGAVGGALIGAEASKDDPLLGAAVGAVVGAIVAGATCFAIEAAQSKPVADYESTRKKERYEKWQGTVVRVRHLDVQPPVVPAGEKFTWRSEYVVLTPDPDAELPITETRIVQFYDNKTKMWKEMGRHKTEVTIKPGTRQDEVEMKMPRKPTSQTFVVTFLVEHGQVADKKSQQLAVATQQVSLSTGEHLRGSAASGEPRCEPALTTAI